MIRLSIVIPIYNAEKFIEESLDNLIKQIKEDDEVILVNDGSTDESEKKCKVYEERYKNIQYHSIPNSGPSKARNTGINKAKGKYLIFLDIDDHIEDDYIEKMLKNIENYDLVICGYNLVKVDKNETLKVKMDKQIIKKENLAEFLFNDKMLNTLWNKTYKLNIIKNNNIQFDETEYRGEDLLFNLDYISNINNDIFIMDDILYNYIMKSTGLNMGFKEKLITKFGRTNKIHKKMMQIKGLDKKKIFTNTIKSYIHHIIFYAKSIIKKILKK